MEPFQYVLVFSIVGSAIMQSYDNFEEPRKNEIEDFHTSTYNSVNSDRIGIVEENVDELFKILDDLARTDKNKFNELISRVSNQSVYLRMIDKYILAPQCGRNIAKGYFEQAEAILPQLQEYYDVIVREAYSKPEDFQNVLRFADAVNVRKNKSTLTLYTELFKFAEQKRHTNVDDYINMYSNMNRRYHTDEWTALKEAVLNSIMEKCFITLTSNGNSYNSENFISCLSTVYDINTDAGRKLMSKVVDNRYNKTDTGSVITYISEHQNLPLRVQGFQTLFFLVERTNNSSNPSLFYLAYEIKQALGLVSLDATTRTELQTLINRFPHSIKTAILSDKVCIQNKKSKNYLKVVKSKCAGWEVLISPGDTTYERSKWKFHEQKIRRWFRMMTRGRQGFYCGLWNYYLQMDLSRLYTSDEIVISSNPFTIIVWTLESVGDYVHMRQYNRKEDKYLSDNEGEPFITNIKDDSATWYLLEC